MADNPHYGSVFDARKKAVAKRREIAKWIAEKGMRDDYCSAFISVQSLIEALDRAEADETPGRGRAAKDA
jgi:hypothetical protein